jgi:hypothetical protein
MMTKVICQDLREKKTPERYIAQFLAVLLVITLLFYFLLAVGAAG